MKVVEACIHCGSRSIGFFDDVCMFCYERGFRPIMKCKICAGTGEMPFTKRICQHCLGYGTQSKPRLTAIPMDSRKHEDDPKLLVDYFYKNNGLGYGALKLPDDKSFSYMAESGEEKILRFNKTEIGRIGNI